MRADDPFVVFIYETNDGNLLLNFFMTLATAGDDNSSVAFLLILKVSLKVNFY